VSDAVLDTLKVTAHVAGKDRESKPQSGTPISDKVIDALKFGRNPEVRAQTTTKKKLPQSGSLVSDAVLDTLKVTAHVAGKDRESKPQSGTPISDKVIDALKFGRNPEIKAQLDSKDWPKPGFPQSGTLSSDAVIDTLKIVSGRGRDEKTA